MTPRLVLAGLAPLVALSASPLAAKTYTFRAVLGGTAGPTLTNSPAGGRATVRVDTSSRRVSIEADVSGIAPDQLSKAWIAKPIGPVTLNDCRGPDDCDAAIGAPSGASYRATRGGFQLAARNLDFAAQVKAMNAPLDFEGLVNGLRAGRIVVVVHTERFADGEISGRTRED
ncbi:MAG: CHRD domain-containing protein [Sphingomonas sp.]|uniref:CHRD domain-containing protein n=1 Tax=Sphingomonas sp. TaxID=28214 RepID=UPI001ACFBE4B|nr:CHRD domain-containing protein [Sphingomonas sp.]MBN8808175.1 CHRD domain-containing protein [Sphingomonas sp.]